MTYPHLLLSANPHDRRGEKRKDQAWLDELWAEPRSRVLVVSGTRVRPQDGALDWQPTAAVPDGMRVLLGERDGLTWFATIVSSELAATEPDAWLPLRGLLPVLADGATNEAPMVLHALGLAEWHWVTRFCPRCGGLLAARSAGHELVCQACGRSQFPRLDPAVIMVVTSGQAGSAEECCLLGRSPSWPPGRFSTLAGFAEPGERLEDTVRREVGEEVGIVVGRVDYFDNQPWPLPASLMLGFVARAESTDIRVDQHEIEDARWFTRAEMHAEAEAGSLMLPGGASISRSLIEHWYGAPLPGRW